MKKLLSIFVVVLIFVSVKSVFAEDDLHVGKGNFRIGVMGSIDQGKMAYSFLNSVGNFTIHGEVEYFLTDYFAPITRVSTTVYFWGNDSITDLVWGAGFKGIFNFHKKYIPYIKIIPSFHFFDITYQGSSSRSFNFDFLAGVGLDILLTKNVAIGFSFHYEVIFSKENLSIYSLPFGLSFYL